MEAETALIWNPILRQYLVNAPSESLWGLWTNDSLPSQKAQELREAVAKAELEQVESFGSGGGMSAAD